MIRNSDPVALTVSIPRHVENRLIDHERAAQRDRSALVASALEVYLWIQEQRAAGLTVNVCAIGGPARIEYGVTTDLPVRTDAAPYYVYKSASRYPTGVSQYFCVTEHKLRVISLTSLKNSDLSGYDIVYTDETFNREDTSFLEYKHALASYDVIAQDHFNMIADRAQTAIRARRETISAQKKTAR